MSKKALHLYVFVVGAAILALEVSASRLLAPFFGSSLLVWGNVLGIVLGALALGYYHGGILADRQPRAATLGALVWVGGLLTCAIPLASPLVLEIVSETFSRIPMFLTLASFASMLALFAFPLFLLGAVTPLANRLGAASVQEIGTVSGSLSAAATAGSLVGVFLPSFLTIPYFGTRWTILGSGVALLLLGTLALKRRWCWIGFLLPLAVAAAGAAPPPPGIVYEKDSPYQHIRVVERNGRRELVTGRGNGIQTVSIGSDSLTGTYFDAMTASAFLLPRNRPPKILIIGLAGGTLIRQLRAFLGPSASIDAVDIDPDMPVVAREYFGLQKEDADIRVEDGRVFLERTDRRYDLIVVDAFSQEVYAPFHLASREFFQLAQSRLAPDGLVALNVIGAPKGDPLPQAVGETVRAAFPAAADAAYGDYNHLIVGGKAIDWGRLASVPPALAPVAAVLLKNRIDITSTRQALTDDRSSIEQLTDRFFWKTLHRS